MQAAGEWALEQRRQGRTVLVFCTHVSRVIVEAWRRLHLVCQCSSSRASGRLARNCTLNRRTNLHFNVPPRRRPTCLQGHGRSAAAAAALLQAAGEASSADEALELVKRRRPGASPNHRQVAALHDWAAKYQR